MMTMTMTTSLMKMTVYEVKSLLQSDDDLKTKTSMKTMKSESEDDDFDDDSDK